jgi:hypothetical protein
MGEKKDGDKTRKRDKTFNLTNTALTKLQRMWDSARFCIVDECSMLSCHWNGLLASRIESARSHKGSDAPFGGVHMIYSGYILIHVSLSFPSPACS